MNDLKDVLHSIILAANSAWIRKPDDTYEYGFGKIVENDPAKYNLMRHLGIKWVHNEIIVNLTNSKQEHLQNCGYLSDALSPTGFLYEHKPLTYKKRGNVVDTRILLGAQGLAIMAFPNYKNYDFVNSILESQLPNGDFIHKYDANGYPLEFRSAYYTGEALLGLCRFINRDPNNKDLADDSLKCVEKSLMFLEPQGYGVKQMSHWMFWALTEYAKIKDNNPCVNIDDWVMKIADYIMLNSHLYRTRDYSAPTACKIEGMMRACHHFGPDSLNTKIMLRFMKEDILFLISCFDGQHFLYGLKGDHPNQWRMDFNQHSIFALYLYYNFICQYGSDFSEKERKELFVSSDSLLSMNGVQTMMKNLNYFDVDNVTRLG
jgi:hypothetical protein